LPAACPITIEVWGTWEYEPLGQYYQLVDKDTHHYRSPQDAISQAIKCIHDTPYRVVHSMDSAWFTNYIASTPTYQSGNGVSGGMSTTNRLKSFYPEFVKAGVAIHEKIARQRRNRGVEPSEAEIEAQEMYPIDQDPNEENKSEEMIELRDTAIPPPPAGPNLNAHPQILAPPRPNMGGNGPMVYSGGKPVLEGNTARYRSQVSLVDVGNIERVAETVVFATLGAATGLPKP
jgi:hypothetical protein